MKLKYIAFKWHADASLEAITPILGQIDLRLLKKNIWSRSVGEHILQVEYREQMSSPDQSFFWLRFSHRNGPTDKDAFSRVLADWFFAMSRHYPTYVNWFQAAVMDIGPFQPVFGFTESSPRIWTKSDQKLRYSFYPYLNYYLFEVKNEDIRKTIQHQRYAKWLDELKHNLVGNKQPDDQICFDEVV
ncbi:hypothetical protein YDYSY3_38010 [Paenibacillus chitinolyticus]|uniref:hypothetical protein n=1 Tax=Paenibacillus chitinolyticus TaxID=79263 RepID=UPI0026E4BB4D|nr:hypothetical protein [Paenibacillus chitinolyticus]GKS12801.1 hypothetical protein YDYSY3_38010 [Paenibacillus chitinolyticus]